MNQKGYYRAIDSLKGLFILIITLHNTLAVTPLFSNIPGTAFITLYGGTLGNSMFFILSGFLLSAGYRHRIQEHTISFRDFLMRRLKKLYPMYLLSNAAALLVELLRYGVSAINIKKIVFTALLIGGPYNAPTWFLFVLFACYIVFFAICYHAKNPTQYLCGIVAAMAVGYTLLGAELDMLFLRASYGIGYMNFFLGCVLAEVYPLLSEKQHRWLQPLCWILVPLQLWLMLANGVEIIAGDTKIAFPFALCTMILYLALADGPCRRILQLNCLVALGKISSCIFFWHLVLYFAFCDLYGLLAPTGSIQEPQYLLYFLLMLLFSAGMTKMAGRKSSIG